MIRVSGLGFAVSPICRGWREPST